MVPDLERIHPTRLQECLSWSKYSLAVLKEPMEEAIKKDLRLLGLDALITDEGGPEVDRDSLLEFHLNHRSMPTARILIDQRIKAAHEGESFELKLATGDMVTLKVEDGCVHFSTLDIPEVRYPLNPDRYSARQRDYYAFFHQPAWLNRRAATNPRLPEVLIEEAARFLEEDLQTLQTRHRFPMRKIGVRLNAIGWA